MSTYRIEPIPLIILEVGESKILVSSRCFQFSTDDSSLHDELSNALAIPVTVLDVQGIKTIDSNWLKSNFEVMLATDDVINEGFTSRILLRTAVDYGKVQLAQDVLPFLASRGRTLQVISTDVEILPGPYVLRSSSIHEVYRLCPDPNGAFMCGMIRSDVSERR